MQNFEQFETRREFTRFLSTLLPHYIGNPMPVYDALADLIKVMNLQPENGDDFANYVERFVVNSYAMSELRMFITSWKDCAKCEAKRLRRPVYIAELTALINAGDEVAARALIESERIWGHTSVHREVVSGVDRTNPAAFIALGALKYL
jgi:hypothetical protein